MTTTAYSMDYDTLVFEYIDNHDSIYILDERISIRVCIDDKVGSTFSVDTLHILTIWISFFLFEENDVWIICMGSNRDWTNKKLLSTAVNRFWSCIFTVTHFYVKNFSWKISIELLKIDKLLKFANLVSFCSFKIRFDSFIIIAGKFETIKNVQKSFLIFHFSFNYRSSITKLCSKSR